MEQKAYSIDACEIPAFLRGFGSLVGMAQNSDFDMTSECLFAIDTVLQYVADDLETQIDDFYDHKKSNKKPQDKVELLRDLARHSHVKISRNRENFRVSAAQE